MGGQGFDQKDFELLKQLVFFSKMQSAVLDCNSKKWKVLQEAGYPAMMRLGRLARRIIGIDTGS